MQRMSEETFSIGANSISTNRLAGLIGEFIKRRTAARAAWVASLTGLKVTFVIGETLVANDAAVSTAARFPNLKDDVAGEYIINPNRRLILTFRNTSGGAITVNWFIDLLN
jgi:hypothetical protein